MGLLNFRLFLLLQYVVVLSSVAEEVKKGNGEGKDAREDAQRGEDFLSALNRLRVTP